MFMNPDLYPLMPGQKYQVVKLTYIASLHHIFVSTESTDESEMDKHHHNSVSSGTYSDYSPSQASSGSSNARVKVQITAKEAVNSSMWGNRSVESLTTVTDTLLDQRGNI